MRIVGSGVSSWYTGERLWHFLWSFLVLATLFGDLRHKAPKCTGTFISETIKPFKYVSRRWLLRGGQTEFSLMKDLSGGAAGPIQKATADYLRMSSCS